MSFKRGVQELVRGQILSPILRVELSRPRFTDFQVPIDGWTPRPFDGWLHPSTHAAWPARKLALYLTQSDLVEEEEPTYEMVLAVTQGHFMHTLVQKLLLAHGILLEAEIYAEDPLHRRRGHMDGRLAHEGLEIKSINQKYLQDKIVDGATLLQYKPGYFYQAQDYLDMHDLPAMRFLIIPTFYPYKPSEFVVHRNDRVIAAQRAKYRQALEAVETGALPDACCAVRSTEARDCELRLACPIGRMAASA